ncbi:hypothetical protein DQ384_15655 [Sphaerisporangium album]|uniref:Uncharacterized protein n=1 Tax=Sphaerisporangium album TaxID=509200 RepID=A0A367FKL2_9ACTN|nr:hypothetical protein [Sphaerisporangium album]RCG30190.1 hypothetical protein DQ384_15655 [Sphaerisporangium album]
MVSFHKKVAGLAASGVLAAGLVVAAASPAAAGTVTASYVCGTYGPQYPAAFTTTVTAPATARRGTTFTVTVDFDTDVITYADEQAGVKVGNMTILLGGAASGGVTATGLTNPATPPGQTWKMRGGTAQVTVPNVGDVTFTPDRYRQPYNAYNSLLCVPQAQVVAATTHVVP